MNTVQQTQGTSRAELAKMMGKVEQMQTFPTVHADIAQYRVPRRAQFVRLHEIQILLEQRVQRFEIAGLAQGNAARAQPPRQLQILRNRDKTA